MILTGAIAKDSENIPVAIEIIGLGLPLQFTTRSLLNAFPPGTLPQITVEGSPAYKGILSVTVNKIANGVSTCTIESKDSSLHIGSHVSFPGFSGIVEKHEKRPHGFATSYAAGRSAALRDGEVTQILSQFIPKYAGNHIGATLLPESLNIGEILNAILSGVSYTGTIPGSIKKELSLSGNKLSLLKTLCDEFGYLFYDSGDNVKIRKWAKGGSFEYKVEDYKVSEEKELYNGVVATYEEEKPVENIHYETGTEQYTDHSVYYVRNFFQDYMFSCQEFYSWDIPIENDFVDYYEMSSSASMAGWNEEEKNYNSYFWYKDEETRKWKVRTNEEGEEETYKKSYLNQISEVSDGSLKLRERTEKTIEQTDTLNWRVFGKVIFQKQERWMNGTYYYEIWRMRSEVDPDYNPAFDPESDEYIGGVPETEQTRNYLVLTEKGSQPYDKPPESGIPRCDIKSEVGYGGSGGSNAKIINTVFCSTQAQAEVAANHYRKVELSGNECWVQFPAFLPSIEPGDTFSIDGVSFVIEEVKIILDYDSLTASTEVTGIS